MSIHIEQFYNHVICPSLDYFESYHTNFNSADSKKLVLATFCHESQAGTFLKQVKGPALGVYQIEPATLDFLQEYLGRKDELRAYMNKFRPGWNVRIAEKVISDLGLATVLCRLRYWTVATPLPSSPTILDLANYWGEYYQTDRANKGAVSDKEKRFMLDAKTYAPMHFGI